MNVLSLSAIHLMSSSPPASENLEEPLNTDAPKDSDKAKSADEMRLAGRPPLKTVLLLAIGPVLSQLANAVFLLVNNLWVSKAIGDDGLAAISTYNAFDGISRAFGFFLAIGAATQISALFGLGKSEEAGQLCADLLRLTFACGAFVPAVLLPSLKPLGRWFGAPEHIISLGWDYMLPSCSCTTTTCMFMTVLGFLQGEGRTLLYGMTNIACLALNGLVLDPLFLFAFKAGIRSVSIATVVSEIIPAVIIFLLYYVWHKFGIKPQWGQFCMCFTKRTGDALKVGVSQLFSQLSVSVPSIVVRKFIGMASGPDEYSDAMAAFNACLRINMVVVAVMMGITMGFVPAASYAYAAKKYKRYLWLSFHSLWLCAVWGAFTCLFTYLMPRYLALMFSSTPGYLDYAENMIRIMNSLAFVGGVRFNVQTMLQSMQCGGRATIVSILNNFGLLTAIAFVFYYTDKTQVERLIWCYPVAFTAGIPISLLLLWKPLMDVWRKSKEETGEETKELEDIKERDELKHEEVFEDNGV